MRTPLPIDPWLDAIRAAVDRDRAAVVVAEPGAGKTTRVPPALLSAGKTMLLQPRRVAARALARRIASENDWDVGKRIGWQVRHERVFDDGTELLVVTEGILVARLLDDPMLSGFRTVVLDEFHERSLQADLALALLRAVREARDDLRIVVMSATLDAEPVAKFLDASVIEVPGKPQPLEIFHEPHLDVTDAIARYADDDGHLLAFFPGAPEIEHAHRELKPKLRGDVAILPLHGSLDARQQERALAPTREKKILLATNLAETSLTVDGVRTVVDTGLHKIPRYDAALGFDRLETERISRDSADQRAGRAARTAPGRAVRLWDPRDELRDHREAEIHRVDLAATLLDLLAWGDDPKSFGWFERPDARRIDEAKQLLQRLGALSADRRTLSDLGKRMRRLPVPPRLARLLLGAEETDAAIRACAALAEGWHPPGALHTTDSDLLAIADRLRDAPRHVRQAADDLNKRLERTKPRAREPIRQAVFAAYPDRLARRRARSSDRFVLANGHGARLAKGSGVRNAEFVVAVELRAPKRGGHGTSESLIQIASAVDPEWIAPTRTDTIHEQDASTGRVRSFEISLYDRLELSRKQILPDPEQAAQLLFAGMRDRPLGDDAQRALHRIRFAGLAFDLDEALLGACRTHDRWFAFDPVEALDWKTRKQLDRLAPATLAVPSGRKVRLDYDAEGSVKASVKLQELFGLAETPKLGNPPTPVTFLLLAPNGRPVQTTQDLESFWENTYPEVRKQLRGRYPKHPWPEDPWTAKATGRTKKRSS